MPKFSLFHLIKESLFILALTFILRVGVWYLIDHSHFRADHNFEMWINEGILIFVLFISGYRLASATLMNWKQNVLLLGLICGCYNFFKGSGNELHLQLSILYPVWTFFGGFLLAKRIGEHNLIPLKNTPDDNLDSDDS